MGSFAFESSSVLSTLSPSQWMNNLHLTMSDLTSVPVIWCPGLPPETSDLPSETFFHEQKAPSIRTDPIRDGARQVKRTILSPEIRWTVITGYSNRKLPVTKFFNVVTSQFLPGLDLSPAVPL